MVKIGRVHWRSSSPPSLLQQGPLEHVILILNLQYVHQLCLLGHQEWGWALLAFARHRKVITKMYYMSVLTRFLFPSAGAYCKQIMALLLSLLSQLAHARKASFLGENKVCPRQCPGRGVALNSCGLLPSPYPAAVSRYQPFWNSPSQLPCTRRCTMQLFTAQLLVFASDSFARNFLVAV